MFAPYPQLLALMNPLDRLLYVFLSLPVEVIGAIVLGKALSDLLVGFLAVMCLVALTRPLPLLRTSRRAGWGLALALAWIGVWWWAPFLYGVVGEVWRVIEGIPAVSVPPPPPPPSSPLLP